MAATNETTAMVEIRDVHKFFGHLHVLRGINLNIEPGQVCCLLGPSGSGKSTLLRCVNQLETKAAIWGAWFAALCKPAGNHFCRPDLC